MRRVDIELTKQFEKAYIEQILKPFVSALTELIRETGFKNGVIPKYFKDKLQKLVQQWGKGFIDLLDDTFKKTEKELYQAYMRELRAQLPQKFRYRRSEYKFVEDNGKLKLLKKKFDHWILAIQTNYAATAWIWKHYAEDGLRLSDRIWKMATQTAKDIEKQVMLALQTGMSARRLRNQILATAEQQEIEIPKWLKEQLKNAEPDEIAKKVARYVEKKQKYNAMRVARTEIQRAWRASYVNMSKKLNFVKGIKWNLSRNHPKKDICDDLASANPVGLGPGIYPKDAVPFNGHPAHPHCRCYLTTVLEPVEEMLTSEKRPKQHTRKPQQQITPLDYKRHFKDLPDTFQEMFEKAFEEVDYNIKRIVEKYGVSKVKLASTSYYDPLEKEIGLSKSADKYTVVHEYGHYIDYVDYDPQKGKFVQLSLKGKLGDTIRHYVNNQRKWASKTVKIFKTEFTEEELRKREFAPLQDIINGLTKGNYRFMWGHSRSYWRYGSKPNYTHIATDVFAELFELYAFKHRRAAQKQIEFIEKYLPDLWKAFTKTLERML